MSGTPPRQNATLRMYTRAAAAARRTEKMAAEPPPEPPKPPSKKPAKGGKAKPAVSPRGPMRPRRRWLTVLKWAALVVLATVALGVASIATIFWWYGRDPNLPRIESISDYQPKQVSAVLDKSGARIGEIFTERRTYVPYDKLPPLLVESFISAEDESFWTHAGIDYWGMARALVTNLKAGKTKQGASTITQQVVKTFFLSPERTFKRKAQEIILARRLERYLNKQEIMTLYVNQIYFGHGRYGVQEAARFYFGVDVDKLNPGQMAVLAGLPKSPNDISPRNNPARAKERQTYVLRQLAANGKLPTSEAQRWIDAPIELVKEAFPSMGAGPEWIDLGKRELETRFGKAQVDAVGASVQVTMDQKVQAAALAAARTGLHAYDERHKIGRPQRTVAADKRPAELTKLTKRRGGDPKRGEIYEALVVAVHDADGEVELDLGEWPATLKLGLGDDARYARKKDADGLTASQRFAPGDVLDVIVPAAPAEGEAKVSLVHGTRRVALAPGPEAAVVVMELGSRKVRAMVGGYAARALDFNRAIAAKRQPGSAFKAFVYAAALASGRYTPATVVNDAPEVFDLWRPQNYSKNNFEGPVRLRYALAKSINTVAIRLTADVTPKAIASLAHAAGITGNLPEELSLSLGSGEVTPLDMANAFATLGAGGMMQPPRMVEAVNGEVTATPPSTRALDPAVAYLITDMMRSVVNEGTAAAAKKLGVTIAGKTGTSNDARDAWFVGMTPETVIAVWVGFDDNRPLGGGETGGTTATPIFVDVFKRLGPVDRSFPRPTGIVDAKIDRATGLLAAPTAAKSSAYSEVFVAGTAPIEVAPVAGEVSEDTLVTGEYGD